MYFPLAHFQSPCSRACVLARRSPTISFHARRPPTEPSSSPSVLPSFHSRHIRRRRRPAEPARPPPEFDYLPGAAAVVRGERSSTATAGRVGAASRRLTPPPRPALFSRFPPPSPSTSRLQPTSRIVRRSCRMVLGHTVITAHHRSTSLITSRLCSSVDRGEHRLTSRTRGNRKGACRFEKCCRPVVMTHTTRTFSVLFQVYDNQSIKLTIL